MQNADKQDTGNEEEDDDALMTESENIDADMEVDCNMDEEGQDEDGYFNGVGQQTQNTKRYWNAEEDLKLT